MSGLLPGDRQWRISEVGWGHIRTFLTRFFYPIVMLFAKSKTIRDFMAVQLRILSYFQELSVSRT